MRFRITVRYPNKTELRGFTTVDSIEELQEWSQAMAPIGMVIASPAEGEDFDPFQPGDAHHAPTPEDSLAVVREKATEAETADEFLGAMSWLHYMQAMVIRGERDQRLEAEQENERLKAALERERAEHESTLHTGQAYMQERDEAQVALDEARAAAAKGPF